MGWVSCFCFCKLTFFFTGNAPLMFKIFNNKTDIALFLISCFYSLMCFYLQLHFWFFWTKFFTSFIFYFSSSFIAMSVLKGDSNFILNNINVIKTSEKQLKLFEYIRNNINNNGFIFIQETHLSSNDEQKWKDNFRGFSISSHVKSNFCGMVISYCETEAFKEVNTTSDKISMPNWMAQSFY